MSINCTHACIVALEIDHVKSRCLEQCLDCHGQTRPKTKAQPAKNDVANSRKRRRDPPEMISQSAENDVKLG